MKKKEIEELAKEVVPGYIKGTKCWQCNNQPAVYVCPECKTHICQTCFNYCGGDGACPKCGAITMY